MAFVLAVLHAPVTWAALDPGNHTVSLSHDGRPRSCIVHVPRGARDSHPLPVVLSFHGGGGRALAQQVYAQMDGHVWPGGTRDYLPRLLGPGTTLVDANREMWRFFQRFTR